MIHLNVHYVNFNIFANYFGQLQDFNKRLNLENIYLANLLLSLY